MAAKFRVVLHQGDADDRIIHESFTAESVEQILRCKPDNVHVEAEKVRDIGPDNVADEEVWLDLLSMRGNLEEAREMTPEANAANIVTQRRALSGLTARLAKQGNEDVPE